ncbi:signal recognition particle-docking protein FtsY [Sulfobacillus acidophilus TPY]|uniref:Signal recognition particle receptor FtsY n=1 Tax=Sulfobacillus acidophilus (strain ATCC 700253 / DSM 10332 / NAL) TaxID=679936 RepID=G8TVH0_SULAD|nr:signal recognition particle-docking protein FtsY [Sulfobacillus acidophilus TPY]AEW05889.1 signal recognition particle-docking protein FtsY [Sulfobacillus acidophilus DSM 10332]
MAGFFERLRQGMARTRGELGDRLRQLFGGRQWSDDLYDEIEEILYEADLGGAVTEIILAELRDRVRQARPKTTDQVGTILFDILRSRLEDPADPYVLPAERPQVWVMVGVNGTGKTTTAGKFAKQFHDRGYHVILGAADTFRAAATEQLQLWGKRAGVEVIHQSPGADPAAVAFDTVRAAVARHEDLAVIDTAGRLHNKANLMQELAKIGRVVGREVPGAPHQVWLVLDATTGQNGLAQARVFQEAINITGIVLTKLDGTAKGGIAWAIQHQLGVPIRFVGVGEGVDDLMPFNPDQYVRAILGTWGEASSDMV